MTCPTCPSELKIAERRGVEIDYCPSCRGIWLDAGELDKIVERSANLEGGRANQQDDESWWERIFDIFD